MKGIYLVSICIGLSLSKLALADTKEKDACCGVKISGYVDASYNYLESSNQFISGVNDRAFDLEEDGFTLQQMALNLAYQPDQGLGGLVNVIFGRDALSTASFGYNPDIGIHNIGFDIVQAYLQYGVRSFTILTGKFLTLAGEEVIDSTANSNFSHSLLFTFAEPFTHTGLRVTYTVNEKLKFIAGVNDGWDNIRDTGRGKTIELAVSYNPCSMFSFSAQGYSGEERTVSRTAIGPTGTRNLIDLIAIYNANDKLAFSANYDYGTQSNAILDNGAVGDAVWQGIAAYLNYKFNDTWRISIRGEDFEDRNGYRTGFAQTIKELTFTVGFTPIKNLEFRAETRRDFSNVFSYADIDTLTPRKVQQSFGLEGIYKFSNS